MSNELAVLRLISIKGRVGIDTIADSLGAERDLITSVLEDLTARELVKDTPMGYRVTAGGRQRCGELVRAEHEAVDSTIVDAIYDEFCAHNVDLKQIITDWQTRGGDAPNDHSDAEYDAEVLARLDALHVRVVPLIERIAQAAPRLAHYRSRLGRAADAVAAGDVSYVSKPILDSYHTVWFELHEDLIGLTGRTRAEEAEAGRGA
jgi:pyruvate,orthophosphate dikinase